MTAKTTAKGTAKLFLSYSRRDRDRIARLHDVLDDQQDLSVFRDTEDILPTEEWKPRLEALIRKSDTVLFALSPASVTSEVCKWEIDLTLSLNKRIIPVVVQDVEGQVPEAVSKLNYIFLTERDNFDRAVGKIIDAIHMDIDWIREHTRIAELADRWAQAKKLGAQPLRGRELDAVESWLMAQPANAPAPTDDQRRYILDSRRKARQRTRVGLSVVGVAFAVVGGLGLMAWDQRNQAVASDEQAQLARIAAEEERRASQASESRFIARRAMELADNGQHEDALALAIRSLPDPAKADDRPLVREAELATIRAYAGLRTENLFELPDKIEVLELIEDGKLAVAGGYRLGLHLLDLQANRILHSYTAKESTDRGFAATVPVSKGITAAAFHPTNRLVATGGGEGRLRLWSVRDGHQYTATSVGKEHIKKLRFSDDGKSLVVLNSDGTLKRSRNGSWTVLFQMGPKAKDFWISADSRYLLVQHRREKDGKWFAPGEEVPEEDIVLTTYDLSTRQAISTRSFPEDEGGAVAVLSGGDQVLLAGRGVLRQLSMADLAVETLQDRGPKPPLQIVLSDDGTRALIRSINDRAEELELRNGAWIVVTGKPRLHGDHLGFLDGGALIWGMSRELDSLKIHSFSAPDDGADYATRQLFGFDNNDILRMLPSGRLLLTRDTVLRIVNPLPPSSLDHVPLRMEIATMQAAPGGDYAVMIAEKGQVFRLSVESEGVSRDLFETGAADADRTRLKLNPVIRNPENGTVADYGNIPTIGFSPDGRFFYAEGNHKFEVFDARSMKRLFRFTTDFIDAQFGRDGESFWIPRAEVLIADYLELTGDHQKIDDEGLLQVNLIDGVVTRIELPKGSNVYDLAQSDDGSVVAGVLTKKYFVVRNGELSLSDHEYGYVQNLGVAPDGSFLLLSDESGKSDRLLKLDTVSGEVLGEVPGLGFVPEDYLFNATGDRVFLNYSGDLAAIDLNDLTLLWHRDDVDGFGQPVLSADEAHIIKISRNRTSRLLSADTGELQLSRANSLKEGNFEPSEGVGYSDRVFGNAILWDVKSGTELMTLDRSRFLSYPVFLHKHQMILRRTLEGELQLTRYWVNADDIIENAREWVKRLSPLTAQDMCDYNLVPLEECS